MDRRQQSAWRRAWASRLFAAVEYHGSGIYTVPSQTEAGKWYAVTRYALAPDGYLYICDCPASERGGVVCAHVAAVHVWRMKHRHGWRVKYPS